MSGPNVFEPLPEICIMHKQLLPRRRRAIHTLPIE